MTTEPAKPTPNQPTPNQPTRKATDKNYPLAIVFIVVAASAAVLAMLSALTGGKSFNWREGSLVFTIFSGVFVGAIVGFLFGMHAYRRFRSAALGLFTGGFVGGFIGPLALASSSNLTTIFVIQIVGAFVLALLGVVLWSAKPDSMWK